MRASSRTATCNSVIAMSVVDAASTNRSDHASRGLTVRRRGSQAICVLAICTGHECSDARRAIAVTLNRSCVAVASRSSRFQTDVPNGKSNAGGATPTIAHRTPPSVTIRPAIPESALNRVRQRMSPITTGTTEPAARSSRVNRRPATGRAPSSSKNPVVTAIERRLSSGPRSFAMAPDVNAATASVPGACSSWRTWPRETDPGCAPPDVRRLRPIVTSRSAAGKGSGLNKSPSTTAKIAALRAIHAPRNPVNAAVRSGCFTYARSIVSVLESRSRTRQASDY